MNRREMLRLVGAGLPATLVAVIPLPQPEPFKDGERLTAKRLNAALNIVEYGNSVPLK